MADKPTYEQLEQKVNFLQTLLDTIESEVFIKDAQGKYLFVNKAFGEDFGVDPKEVVGKDDFFVFSPETAEILQENDRQIMAGKKAVNIEENTILRGQHVTYLTNKVPFFNNDGNVIGIYGIGMDITQQKKMEKALRESEVKYQDLYNSAPDMFVSVDAKTAKIIECNQTLVNALGYEKEEIVGRLIFEIYTPESAEYAKKSIFPVFQKTGKIKEEDVQLQRKDGSKIDVSLNVSAVYDKQGQILFSRSVFHDITRRKKIETLLEKARLDLEKNIQKRTSELSETIDKLRDAKLRYRTVADFTYDWEYWSNLDGTLEYVSPSCERVSGYTPRQFMEKPSLFRDIIIPEDRVIWDAHFNDSRVEPSIREIHFRIQMKGDQRAIRWIEHVCQPISGDQGEVLGFRASNRDITSRKEGEIKLQSAYSEIKMLKTQLEAEQTYLREEIKRDHNYENIIGNSDALKYVLFRTQQVASTDTTVLILGETGTGKELIARAIHNASSRKDRPLIKVNCASLPTNLIESELFGHEKGAFTDAVEKRIGRFELANGATIFLDEIGELPLELQPKLLRVLQEGEYERLGSSKTLRTDVRIIAATNRDLEKDVHNKKFRMDLWYRLNVFTISIPPLRERIEDIDLLINYMIGIFERKLGKKITSVPPDVLSKLKKYSWPGNIRELENVIERTMINSQGNTLQLEELLNVYHPVKANSPDLPIKSLEEMEREHILLALKKTNWVIHGEDGAAVLLKINPSTLRGRMRKHEISRPPYTN